VSEFMQTLHDIGSVGSNKASQVASRSTPHLSPCLPFLASTLDWPRISHLVSHSRLSF
jgi:hypothetical protein